MADTIGGGDFGKCEDCGKDHSSIIHWGPLVPDKRHTTLCGSCFGKRGDWFREHKSPLSIPAPVEEVMKS